MPTIFKMLDLSTNHLPEDLGQDLNSASGVTAYELEYGWLLYVPQDIDATLAEHTPEGFDESDDDVHDVPQVVVTIWRYAERHDCKYVMFDRDADAISDLPSWEW